MTSNLRCVLFDLDGTLITSYMDNPDKDYHKWDAYPDAIQVVANARAARVHVGIITNQAGVGFGYTTEAEWELKRDRACEVLGIDPRHVWVCFAHAKAQPPYNERREVLRRKPNGAMIEEAMRFFRVTADQTLYVGDMDSDAEAARHARVNFSDDMTFFGRSDLPAEVAEKIAWREAA